MGTGTTTAGACGTHVVCTSGLVCNANMSGACQPASADGAGPCGPAPPAGTGPGCQAPVRTARDVLHSNIRWPLSSTAP